MKDIYRLLIIVTALFFFTGCGNEWLDAISPQTSVETNKSLNTDREADYAMNGIYTLLRNFEYYGARYTYYADATGEDMQARNDTKRVAKYYLFQLNAVSAPSSFWNLPLYRPI